MKPTSFKRIAFFSLLALLTAACGGGGGGSSSGSSSNNLNGPGTGNLNTDSKANLQKVKNWYSGAEKNNFRPYVKYSSAIPTQNSNPATCPGEIKRVWIFDICVYSNESSGGSNTTSVGYLVGIGQNNNVNKPYFCKSNDLYNCVENQQVYGGKSTNVKLKEALTGKNNTLYLSGVTRHQTLPNVYHMVYTTGSLSTQPSVIYTIDTSLHSIYNPVEVIDYQSAQPTQTYIRRY